MNSSRPLRSIFAILTFFGLSYPSFSASSSPVTGHVEGWGHNPLGQTSIPLGLDNVVAVAAGYDHSLALLANGTVVAWGGNFTGQTNVPGNLSNVVAIAASTHSVALKNDGTVIIWGSSDPAVTNIPPNLTGVVAISAGSVYTLALRTNRTLVAWGVSFAGQTNVPPGLDNVIDFSAGRNHVLALKSDGSIVGWGLNDSGQATHPPGLTGVAAVRAGQFTSFAIKTNGTVFKWGGSFDSNDPPSSVSGLVDLRLGNQHVIGLRSDGTVTAWGFNASGQGSVPPGLSGVTAISAGGNFNLVLTRRPLITEISAPVFATVGATVVFTVKASGPPLSYQWQHRDSNLSQQTNSSISLTNVQPADAGAYTVLVSNPYGSVLSPSTSLSFPPPQITTQPKDLTRNRGETATFNVVADGLAPFTYQWKKGNNPLPGATGADLTLSNLSTADSGTYSVVVTDVAGGTVVSAPATLQVMDPNAKRVELYNNFFSPAQTEIQVGDSVTWVNLGATHSTTSASGLFRMPPQFGNWQFTYTFQNAGTYPFYCEVHPGGYGSVPMQGSVTVYANNTPPALTINSPTNGAMVMANDPLLFSVTATDNMLVKTVEFLDGETFLGSDTNAPYEQPLLLAPGTHTLAARAVDNLNASTTNKVAITVDPNKRPSILLLQPTPNQTVSAEGLDLHVNASDPDGSVVRVDYFADNADDQVTLPVLIGFSTNTPFGIIATNVPLGRQFITAAVTDNAGASKISSPVPITVGNGPAISFSRDGAFIRFVIGPTQGQINFQSTTDVVHGPWTTLWTNNPSGGSIESSVPISGKTQFFRLYID
jgi:plastocyanin